MNKGCPNCHADLKFKWLQTTPVRYSGIGGSKGLMPQCPNCEALLTPNHNLLERWAGIASFVCFVAIVAAFKFLDTQYAALITFILIITCGTGLYWLYNGYLKHWMRWKQPEEGSLESNQLDIRWHDFYRTPRRNERFDRKAFIERLLYMILFVPMALFGGFMMNDSIHEAVFIGVVAAVAVALSATLDGLYDMGFVWSGTMLFGSWLFCFIVSVLIHPLLFGWWIFT